MGGWVDGWIYRWILINIYRMQVQAATLIDMPRYTTLLSLCRVGDTPDRVSFEGVLRVMLAVVWWWCDSGMSERLHGAEQCLKRMPHTAIT